jgi:hypothetical protein
VLLICTLALGDQAATPTTAPAPAPTTAPIAPSAAQTYDLRFRPAVGMRWAYQCLVDSEMNLRGMTKVADSDTMAESQMRNRANIVVDREEITEMRNGRAVARRVTFGKDCWSATKQPGKASKKIPLFCAGTTTNVRLTKDGTLQMDGMGRPTPEEMRRLRSSMRFAGALYAGHPVTIGEQWRSDDGLRAIAGLAAEDDISTAFVLTGVREQDGRQVADLALAARAVVREQATVDLIEFRGRLVIDMATGLTVKADLIGKVRLAGVTRDEKIKKDVKVTGNGKVEIHAVARVLSEGRNRNIAATAVEPTASVDPADLDTDNDAE